MSGIIVLGFTVLQGAAMFVFEIVFPGTWLDYEDRDWTWEVEGILRNLESQFFEANSALNLFVGAQAARPSFAGSDEWARDSQRRSEIISTLMRERTDSFCLENWEEIHFEAEVLFKREKWSNGNVPREFDYKLPFIYARTFLYALDYFEKHLRILEKETNVPAQISSLCAQMKEDFPDLTGVRDTSHHLEDRSRGLDRYGQPLDLKPVLNGAIHAPGGGVLILSSLNGTRYGSTMADGHFGEVDVSPESMMRLQRILEGVLQSFRWRGPKRHAPSA